MAKASKNKVLLADGSVFQLDETANSYIAFNSAFNALPVSPRSGYDKYWNNNGFTNPKSRRKLKPQGVGKLLAQLGEQAYEIISRGGKPAEEMKSILAGFGEYLKVAPECVAQSAAETLEATPTPTPTPTETANTESVATETVASEAVATEAVVEKATEAVPAEPIAAEASVAAEVATPQDVAAEVVAEVSAKVEEPTEENTAPMTPQLGKDHFVDGVDPTGVQNNEPEAVEVELLADAK